MTPEEILDFWYRDSSRQFNGGEAFDEEIREKYGELYQQAKKGELSDWEKNPEGTLALVIILDQFPRNMFRNTREAYETDAQARRITKYAISVGFDKEIAEERRMFLYMPLMHSEKLDDQDLSLEMFGVDNPFAKEHRDILVKFGRFPYMNEALGREMTPEEEVFMQEHGGF